MKEYEISSLKKDDMLNEKFMNEIFNNYDEEERGVVLQEVLSRAKDLGITPKIKREINRCTKKNELIVQTGELIVDVKDKISFNQNGRPEPTIENYKNIITLDKKISQHIQYNSMSNKFEYWENGMSRDWRDSDDAFMLSYIENTYGLYDDKKYQRAILTSQDFFEYHPVKRLIEQEEWDGEPRLDRFLVDIMKCEDDDYSREVSRMIFYGGIHRIYDPGCKFDYMPIFIGKQGCFKSSMVEWLNISGNFYREVLSIDGAKGVESINGGWICEFSELQGMVNARDLESLKGYVTRTTDSYRPPYGRYTITEPRQCIFIGTTNDSEFLTDKTGNRRYLPIHIGLSSGQLPKPVNEIKNYILQCWREAKYLMDEGDTYLVIPRKYIGELEKHQNSATTDDPSIGLLRIYLEKKPVGERICTQQIISECLNGIWKKCTRKELLEINRMMGYFSNWEKNNNPCDLGEYGRQRYWKKIAEDVIVDDYDDELD